MRFETLQENLKRALSIVMPAVAGKSTLPVLSCIQLIADDDGLWLVATNLEVGIKTRIGAKIEDTGSVCLPGKLLSDLIAGLPNVPISFALDEKSQVVSIRAGRFKTELHGIESDEFPTLITTADDPLLSMPGNDWHSVADKVAMSAATDNTRPVLTCVHIFSGKSGVTFEATDGYRLSRKTFAMDCGVVDTLIPAASLTMVRKVFSGDAGVALSMANSGALALFTSESTAFTSRVIDGRHPDLDRLIPTTYTSRVVAPVADLLSAIRLAKPFADADNNRLYLDLTEMADREGKLGVFAAAREIGEHSSVVDVLVTGDPVRIVLDARYLLEAIGACGSGDVAIELQDASRPVVLRPVGDDTILQVVMSITVRG